MGPSYKGQPLDSSCKGQSVGLTITIVRFFETDTGTQRERTCFRSHLIARSNVRMPRGLERQCLGLPGEARAFEKQHQPARGSRIAASRTHSAGTLSEVYFVQNTPANIMKTCFLLGKICILNLSRKRYTINYEHIQVFVKSVP